MPSIINKLILYLRLFWSHLVFWTFPTLEETHFSELGVIYFELYKYRKAISLLRKSERAHNNQDPSFTRYNKYYLGLCYLNLGDFRNAILHFEDYLKYRRKDHEIMSIVAWCYNITMHLISFNLRL